MSNFFLLDLFKVLVIAFFRWFSNFLLVFLLILFRRFRGRIPTNISHSFLQLKLLHHLTFWRFLTDFMINLFIFNMVSYIAILNRFLRNFVFFLLWLILNLFNLNIFHRFKFYFFFLRWWMLYLITICITVIYQIVKKVTDVIFTLYFWLTL